jgi:hypothetical protein
MCFSKPKIQQVSSVTPPPPPAPSESAAAKQGVPESIEQDVDSSKKKLNKLRIQLASNQGVSGVNIPQ